MERPLNPFLNFNWNCAISFNRSVAILTGPFTHLDHLGILSAILEIPLIVTEHRTWELAKKYYPQIDAYLMELSDLSLDFLCHHFDVIFESGRFWAAELKPAMELFYQKKMRFVFCPHGNSDKGHSFLKHPLQDLCLVYGSHLRSHWLQTGAARKMQGMIRTGNFRHAFYRRFRHFYDPLIEKEIFSTFSCEKPILLYAPTWQDAENPSSFIHCTESAIDHLSQNYHLIIKPHPFLCEDHPEKILQLQTRYQNHPSVCILHEMPLIYPLLNRVDMYLGDSSSIGYDFLVFDRPLYFCNPSPESPLQHCGITLKDLSSPLPPQCPSLYQKQRQSLKKKTFGTPKSTNVLRSGLYKKLFT